MPRPFQEWASDEIRRLRAEAESLELALRKYLASEASETPKTNGAEHPESTRFREPTRRRPSPPKNRNRSGGSKHVSKNSLMLDFINKAGADGVTADEVYRFAREGPIGIELNASRSMLWDLNRKGRLTKRGGRYYSLDSGGPRSIDPGLPLEH